MGERSYINNAYLVYREKATRLWFVILSISFHQSFNPFIIQHVCWLMSGELTLVLVGVGIANMLGGQCRPDITSHCPDNNDNNFPLLSYK